MITKKDVLLLLTEMQNSGIDTKNEIASLFKSNSIPLDVLKFINDKRQLDVTAFYELIRKNGNQNKSKLYKNIMKDDYADSDEALTTLCALLLQINLFSIKLEDNSMFLKHVRAADITKVLNGYYTNYDLIPCYQALQAIRADIYALEQIQGRR